MVIGSVTTDGRGLGAGKSGGGGGLGTVFMPGPVYNFILFIIVAQMCESNIR